MTNAGHKQYLTACKMAGSLDEAKTLLRAEGWIADFAQLAKQLDMQVPTEEEMIQMYFGELSQRPKWLIAKLTSWGLLC